MILLRMGVDGRVEECVSKDIIMNYDKNCIFRKGAVWSGVEARYRGL